MKDSIRIRQATKTGYIEVPRGGGVRLVLPGIFDKKRKIPTRTLPHPNGRTTGDILL